MKVYEILEAKETLDSLRAERDRLHDKQSGPGGNPRDTVNIDHINRKIKAHPDYKQSIKSSAKPKTKEPKRDSKAEYVARMKKTLKDVNDREKAAKAKGK